MTKVVNIILEQMLEIILNQSVINTVIRCFFVCRKNGVIESAQNTVVESYGK